jgi:hypothetical protein
MADERPEFVGKGVFAWNDRGYRFRQTPPMTLMSPSALKHVNPWIVLAGVLERAKGGDFSSLPQLTECIRSSNNPSFWRAAFDLLGVAGSMPVVKSVFHEFRPEIVDQELAVYQRHVAYTLSGSLFLWAVPLLLDIYLGSTNREETGIITVLISRAMEKELGPIAAATLPDHEYRDLVRTKYEKMCAELAGDSAPVLYGSVYSVRALIAHLLDMLNSEDPIYASIMHDRRLFESATGIDCSRLFENGELKAERAIAILEDFMMGGGLEKYETGVRYFIGNPIDG